MLHIMYKDSGHGLLSTEYPKLFDRERITINLQKKNHRLKTFQKYAHLLILLLYQQQNSKRTDPPQKKNKKLRVNLNFLVICCQHIINVSYMSKNLQ